MARKPLITRDMTLSEALHRVVLRYPRRTALLSANERVSYGELLWRVHALAGHLARLGLKRGDRVAAVLWSDAELVYLFFAVAHLGGLFAPLPPRLRSDQMEDFLRELDPVLVVASTQIEVAGGIDALRALQASWPATRHLLIVDEKPAEGPSFQDMLVPLPGENVRDVPQSAADPMAVLYTSGTTGRAKGVIHSHRGLIAPVVSSMKLREMWMTFFPEFQAVNRWFRVLFRYGARLLRAAGRPQTFISTMGMHTIAGLEAMLQALLMGDRLVLAPRFHPLHILELIEKHKATVLIGTPLSYTTMLRTRGFERHRIGSLLICAIGAAPCPPELAREVQKRFRAAVHIGFGMTELGGGISATSLEDAPSAQAETVGRPMPGMEVRIVDEERRPVDAGIVGEVAVRSDSVMLGYFGSASGLEAITDEEGWLYTGDLGVMDAQEYVRIVGRKKDVIIRGGQKIYPARIENLLVGAQGVREAAAVGVPDALGGESVWLFVIPEDGYNLTEAKILEACRSSLEAHEVPQQVRIVSDFPRASSGKAQKARLREMAQEELVKHGRTTNRQDTV